MKAAPIRCDLCGRMIRLPPNNPGPSICWTVNETNRVAHSPFVHCGVQCFDLRPPFTHDIPLWWIAGPLHAEYFNGRNLPAEYNWTPEALEYVLSFFRVLAKLGFSSLSARRVAGPCVYFIQADEHGPIKVGWSKNPEDRLAALQTGNPARLRIIATVPGSPDLEKRLHALLDAHRMEGEWFNPAPEVLTLVKYLQLTAEATR